MPLNGAAKMLGYTWLRDGRVVIAATGGNFLKRELVSGQQQQK